MVKGIFALLLAAPGVACAAGSGTAPNDIKVTNYPIPSTNVYYVSPDGKDTNTGSLTSPWSVAKALKSASSGATIVFRGGTYRDINANIPKKLTLQAYPHEKPWLKGSVEVQGWVKDGTIWRKDGWSYSFPSIEISENIDPKYPLAGYRDMVYINGVSLKQVASKAEVVAGTFYVDAANKQLYIGDNPAAKMVEATALTQAFNMWKSTWSDPSHSVVRGLGFAHYADKAISVGAPHVTLENNTFAWNGIQGAGIFATDGIVRGNTFSYNGRKGLGGREAHRILVQGNTITSNNVERFAKTWDASGVKFGATDELLWRDNLVEHNLAVGLWVDESSTNATIVNNIVRHNESVGIYFEISHKALIAANVVHNNTPAGIFVLNSSSARVYNNTLAYNHANIIIRETPRNNTNAKEIAQGITWITRANVVKNNILSNTTSGPLFYAPNCDTKQASKLTITTADYNAYYRTSSSTPKNFITWSLDAGKCSVGYTSIAAFNSATGFEANALAIDNVATNPFFIDEANGDYRLKPGSPAIGRGAPLPADIASAVGLPAGVALDLGALQSKPVLVQ